MSDRRELEAFLRCPVCHGAPYRLYRRHVSGSVWLHEVEPVSPDLPPPDGQPTCPHCQVACRWEAVR